MNKTDYLYAFEHEFRKLCDAHSIRASDWALGMWTNAHMHYGRLSPEAGAAEWFKHVKTERGRRLDTGDEKKGAIMFDYMPTL